MSGRDRETRERVLRTATGLALMLAGSAPPAAARWQLRVAGAVLALSGLTGWCPAYYMAGVTSIDGPGDRPDESHRERWLAPRESLLPGSPSTMAGSRDSGVPVEAPQRTGATP